jgi:hypothetical protein
MYSSIISLRVLQLLKSNAAKKFFDIPDMPPPEVVEMKFRNPFEELKQKMSGGPVEIVDGSDKEASNVGTRVDNAESSAEPKVVTLDEDSVTTIKTEEERIKEDERK